MPTSRPTPAAPVVVFGEALIDLFAPKAGIRLEDAEVFHPKLGGAPANVAVQLARLSTSVALISAVGMDPFGRRVRRMLEDEGVDVSHVIEKKNRTGVTLVQVDADGERSFTPFREKAADLALTLVDLDANQLRRASIVHTGTVTLRTKQAQLATKAARTLSPQALQTLDVNLRPGMFPNLDRLCGLARGAVRGVDVVKATREEAEMLYGAVRGESDEALISRILDRGPALVLLTLDEAGAVLGNRSATARVPSPSMQVVDATGAGDAFMGAAISQLPADRNACGALSETDLKRIGAGACEAGACAITALGATTAMTRVLHGGEVYEMTR